MHFPKPITLDIYQTKQTSCRLMLFFCLVWSCCTLFSARKRKRIFEFSYFWSLSFPTHRTLYCDKVETSFEENHYHLGHKLRCTLPLIQDISQESEATTEHVLLKKLFLKISQYSQENNCVKSPFNKVAGLQTWWPVQTLNFFKILSSCRKISWHDWIKWIVFLESAQKSDLENISHVKQLLIP